MGYAEAGYALAGAAASLLAQDYEGDALSAALEELETALSPPSPEGIVQPPDDARVLAWFDRHLPRCMALVPRRRRWSFLAGVYRVALDEGWTSRRSEVPATSGPQCMTRPSGPGRARWGPTRTWDAGGKDERRSET